MICDVAYAGKSVRMNALNPDDRIQNEWLGGYFYETVAGSRQGMLNYIYHNLRHLRDGVWVDAGANVGNHTVFFSAICGAERVAAIEPVAANIEILKSNLAVNDITNVDLYEAALGAEPGMCSMPVVDGGNAGLHEVVAGNETEMLTLDFIAESSGLPVRLLKIDVENYNLPLLQGSTRTLDRDHPVVFAECADTVELVTVNGFMAQHGYELVRGLILNYTPTYLWTPVDSCRRQSGSSLG